MFTYYITGFLDGFYFETLIHLKATQNCTSVAMKLQDGHELSGGFYGCDVPLCRMQTETMAFQFFCISLFYAAFLTS